MAGVGIYAEVLGWQHVPTRSVDLPMLPWTANGNYRSPILARWVKVYGDYLQWPGVQPAVSRAGQFQTIEDDASVSYRR